MPISVPVPFSTSREAGRYPCRRSLPRNVLQRWAWFAAVPLVAVPLFAAAGARAQVPPVGATAEVRDAANRLVATAEFREGRGEALITLRFPSPPVLSGTHGVHIHEMGRCDPPDFLTAGGIFNPTNKKHGRQNPQGPEIGDLPNINVTTGLTTYNTSAPGATLGSGQASLLGPNRTALVVFSGEDDQMTDPEGNAGSRIACGVITAAPAAAAQAGGPAAPTPTATRPAAAPAAPKVASSVATQPVAGQPAQPAPRPANSPVVVRPPAVVKPASSRSPANVVPALPTAIVAPTAAPVAAAQAQSGNSLGGSTALIIVVLGLALVSAGYLLRRRSQLP